MAWQCHLPVALCHCVFRASGTYFMQGLLSSAEGPASDMPGHRRQPRVTDLLSSINSPQSPPITAPSTPPAAAPNRALMKRGSFDTFFHRTFQASALQKSQTPQLKGIPISVTAVDHVQACHCPCFSPTASDSSLLFLHKPGNTLKVKSQ